MRAHFPLTWLYQTSLFLQHHHLLLPLLVLVLLLLLLLLLLLNILLALLLLDFLYMLAIDIRYVPDLLNLGYK